MTLRDKTNFGAVLSISITEHPSTVVRNDLPIAYLDALYTFPTDKTFWVSLDPYGFFGWPEGHKRWLDIGLFHDAAKRDYSLIWVDTHPDFPKWCWVLPFPSLVASGVPLGVHPSGAWVMEKSLWQNWMDGKLSFKIKAIVGGAKQLNIRSEANDTSAIVGTLSIGQSFTLLPDAPITNKYVWRRIQQGWIAYSLVII